MSATLKNRRVDTSAPDAMARYEALFSRDENTGEPQWLRDLRAASIQSAAQKGLPTTRDEEYRFLDLRPIYALDVHLPQTSEYSENLLQGHTFDDFEGHRLVFVNGEYSETLSQIGELPAGATLGNMASRWDDELVSSHVAQYAEPYYELMAQQKPVHDMGASLLRLNTAFFRDGLVLHLARGCTLEAPIHVLFYTDALSPLYVAPRVLVIAEEESSATIIEHRAGRGSYFSNGISEVVMGKKARIEHTRIQMESDDAYQLSTLHVQMADESVFSSHAVDFGGKTVRNNATAAMMGEHIECTLNGLYVGRGEQVIGNHTVMEHAEPNCNSYEIYTGILTEKSRGVFNGKIFVRRDAQKTDAKQSNRNLILSDDAAAFTKPQLEIFADDVKCTHGATVGQLDEEALFYLRSRGIEENAARALLIHAFAREAMEGIASESVLNYLEAQLYARLG